MKKQYVSPKISLVICHLQSTIMGASGGGNTSLEIVTGADFTGEGGVAGRRTSPSDLYN